MSLFAVATFIAVLSLFSFLQSTLATPHDSDIVVLSFRWYKFLPDWDRPPLGAAREPYRDSTGKVHNPPIVLDASPPPRSGYKYKAKVINRSRKTVEVIEWEYRFIEKSGQEIHPHQFRTMTKIGVGKSKELIVFSYDPPSRTIDVASLDRPRPYPVEEQVLINRVEYSDGSVWQRPLASGIRSNPPAESVTFSKDIAPILNRNCVACHRPGNIAPMSLLAFKDAQPWADRIVEKVVSRQMPPWHADPGEIEFSNERRLSEREIEKIVSWVRQGAKEGDSKDLPPALSFAEGWQIGQPDAVFSLDEDYVLDADFVDNYIYLRISTNFKEDRWIQAVELRPGNLKVVHHAVAFIETPEDFWQRERLSPAERRGARVWSLLDTKPLSIELMDGTTRRIKPDAPIVNDGCSAPDPEELGGRNNSDVLTVYAPGREADVWPTGTAKRVPAGSNLIFQMHYSKRPGKLERDRTRVAVVFAKGPVERMVGTRSISNQMFAIPPGAENHEVTACWTYQRDVELISFMPHMHVRGKSMRYEVVYPGQKRQMLLNVPRYSFHWQTLYLLKKPLMIPSGSRLIVTAHFDNSKRNMHNPDPSKTIRHGSASFDEMMIGFVNYFIPKPPDPVAIKVDPNIYDAYIGLYEFDPTSIVTVSRVGDKLFVEAGGQRVELLPISETTFFPKARDSQLTFVKNEKGEVTGFITTQNDTLIRFKKKLTSQNRSR